MPSKKEALDKSKRRSRAAKPSPRGPKLTLALPPSAGWSSNGTTYEYQRIKNPYVPGEREKMLDRREALTLKAFQLAYETHHSRKGS